MRRNDSELAQPSFPPRRQTRCVAVGPVRIGGGARLSVQSMTKCPTTAVNEVLAQIQASRAAGADFMRVAVPNRDAVKAFREIKQRSPLPLVADVHFDHTLAIAAAEAGADKLRLNPGNLGGREPLAEVAAAARVRGIPIRIGVNAGSLEADLLKAYGGPTPEALCESALRNVSLLEELGFRDVVVSIKASDVRHTVQANRLFAERSNVPLHLGITEAGFGLSGVVGSAIGLGVLLYEGLGDTIRVSLTEPPEREVEVAIEVLKALGLRGGPRLVSCPTCGRCRVDLRSVTEAVKEGLRDLVADLTVAVMGCEVNGPGEAREADVGIASGAGRAVLFVRGKKLRTVPIEQAAEALLMEVRKLAGHSQSSPAADP
ncbi:MAG: flavodoxin-dependent (E)-4-hydroxy-3-methylbut-2-enyl-diphosphate synthase [Candidatus Zipacnadales bacterium]